MGRRLTDARAKVLDLLLVWIDRLAPRSRAARGKAEGIISAADGVAMLAAAVPAIQQRQDVKHVPRKEARPKQYQTNGKSEERSSDMRTVRHGIAPAAKPRELLDQVQREK